MQAGKPSVPLRIDFDPLSRVGTPGNAGRQLKRLLIAESSQQAFQETRRQLSEGARNNTANKGQAAFYGELADRLNGLASSLALPKTLTSVSSLDLGASGPDASLATLASSLGLQPGGGRYSVVINDQRLSFDPSQSLTSVLSAISDSSAGVTASYDATTRRVSLTQRSGAGGGPVSDDVEGNLLDGLKLGEAAQASGARYSTLDDLRQVALGVSDTLSLIESATAAGGPRQDDKLLKDLRDALGDLFQPSRSGTDGALQSLGDLGFTRQGGQLTVDEARVSALGDTQPEAVASFARRYVQGQVAPLLANGGQALADATARAPFEQRLAEQAVHVRAELARLKGRQELLLSHQAAVDKVRDALKDQDDKLERLQKRHDVDKPSDSQDDKQGSDAASPAKGLDASSKDEATPAPAKAFGLGD